MTAREYERLTERYLSGQMSQLEQHLFREQAERDPDLGSFIRMQQGLDATFASDRVSLIRDQSALRARVAELSLATPGTAGRDQTSEGVASRTAGRETLRRYRAGLLALALLVVSGGVYVGDASGVFRSSDEHVKRVSSRDVRSRSVEPNAPVVDQAPAVPQSVTGPSPSSVVVSRETVRAPAAARTGAESRSSRRAVQGSPAIQRKPVVTNGSRHTDPTSRSAQPDRESDPGAIIMNGTINPPKPMDR